MAESILLSILVVADASPTDFVSKSNVILAPTADSCWAKVANLITLLLDFHLLCFSVHSVSLYVHGGSLISYVFSRIIMTDLLFKYLYFSYIQRPVQELLTVLSVRFPDAGRADLGQRFSRRVQIPGQHFRMVLHRPEERGEGHPEQHPGDER